MVAPAAPITGPESRSATVQRIPAAARAAMILQALPGLGPLRFRRLVDHFGSPGSALEANTSEFADLAGKRAAAARRGAVLAARADEMIARCRDAVIGLLVYGTPGYPSSLKALRGPPSVLFFVGRSELLHGPCVAVVGSRRATAYGRRIARRLGAHLAGTSRCVVSGMAMGIDAEAHRGALPGPTAAVLGSGVDVVSPPRNASLYRRILESGVVVSEYAPGVKAEPHHFPARNRIIAALATDVIIVEASNRSGALITADIALDLGREVHAVPGPIDRPTSAGTNRLIVDGAGVIVDTGPGDAFPGATALPAEPDLRTLLLAVPPAPVTLEELARVTKIPVEDVATSVTVLEIRGYLTPTRDGRVMRTPGRRGTDASQAGSGR
ncbi:MAG: DNA-processing protein DprA [Gemmatimonadetes bacterium]|nr:DNA-processing protein DprA [Gemmatimonadota bacterium]MCY3611834.1 DNA-processing protein DprA [Gemmatimonadota bacterium]MCY3676886.1 DNA-processing protein DprA [Gemmatimonadota bacterium]MYA40816.1 DNA-protecting protein DprA [Gemmatimonadota bacterium]MYE94771.1 DNA-protecting protein DprA [Gemmatimonadota bacterium]